jgi:hypothetical protein
LPKKWGGRTTPFLAKGWLRPPHTGRMGVAEATPGLWGWSGHPERPKKKKKKKRKNAFWPLGVAGPPPSAWGWLRTPLAGRRWWLRPPPCPWGWSGHPQRPKPIFPFFFGGGGAFWGGRTTPKGLGWLRPPPYGRYGVGEATPWPKMGWSGHPIFWARGGSSHPDFYLFFFLIFNFLLFFFQKKKKNLKCKTTPFCPKRHRFGRA